MPKLNITPQTASDDANTARPMRTDGFALSNALPLGMRDELPPQARRQSRVGRRVMAAFELYGYNRVWLPTFEYNRVLERTRGGVGSSLRFVEPDSGEVVALRSDMTPQVARLVCTRYQHAPTPIRLCYQGSVLRRRRERARTESQVVQAGIELVGMPGADADYEVLTTLSAAVRKAGLEEFVLDVGHAAISRSLLASLTDQARADVVEALSAKDSTMVERLGRASGLGRSDLRALVSLPELHGGAELWDRAERVLSGTCVAGHVAELKALWSRVVAAELAPDVVIDLGETQRHDYYTGPMFSVLAHGPGEPIAAGGRYDALYDRFGQSRPAAGVALDITNACWALERAGRHEPDTPRVVASQSVPEELLSALRARNVPCMAAWSTAREYAQAWGVRWVLEPTPGATGALTLSRLRGSGQLIDPGNSDAQAAQISELIAAGADEA